MDRQFIENQLVDARKIFKDYNLEQLSYNDIFVKLFAFQKDVVKLRERQMSLLNSCHEIDSNTYSASDSKCTEYISNVDEFNLTCDELYEKDYSISGYEIFNSNDKKDIESLYMRLKDASEINSIVRDIKRIDTNGSYLSTNIESLIQQFKIKNSLCQNPDVRKFFDFNLDDFLIEFVYIEKRFKDAVNHLVREKKIKKLKDTIVLNMPEPKEIIVAVLIIIGVIAVTIGVMLLFGGRWAKVAPEWLLFNKTNIHHWAHWEEIFVLLAIFEALWWLICAITFPIRWLVSRILGLVFYLLYFIAPIVPAVLALILMISFVQDYFESRGLVITLYVLISIIGVTAFILGVVNYVNGFYALL